MKYTKLYRDQLEMFKSSKNGRQALKSLFGKQNVSFPKYVQVIRELIISETKEDSCLGGEHFKLLSQELYWRESGSPVIFLESQKLVSDLYAAKFDFEKDFSVAPPFKSFALSFPENTLINGVPLKSCLVTIMTNREFVRVHGEEYTSLNHFLSKEYQNDELGIAVHYESSFGVINSNFAYLYKLAETLKNNAKNPLADNGTVMLEAQTKIALALCMYHSATNGEKLKAGYPSASIELPKDKSKGSYKAVTVRSFDEERDSTGRTVTHRVPHFRNLRAECFYKKDEYKYLKRGSRWTFVRGVDRNGSVNTLVQ
ncbi:TPA: hypothetical protein ACVU5N_003238 [Vibrio parahaemolyticus]